MAIESRAAAFILAMNGANGVAPSMAQAPSRDIFAKNDNPTPSKVMAPEVATAGGTIDFAIEAAGGAIDKGVGAMNNLARMGPNAAKMASGGLAIGGLAIGIGAAKIAELFRSEEPEQNAAIQIGEPKLAIAEPAPELTPIERAQQEAAAIGMAFKAHYDTLEKSGQTAYVPEAELNNLVDPTRSIASANDFAQQKQAESMMLG